MSYNKIEAVNGKIFHNLKQLEIVLLRQNYCIDEEFSSPARIVEMQQIITQKCGFCTANEDDKNCEMALGFGLLLTAKVMDGLLKKRLTKDEEIMSKDVQISLLKAELDTAKNFLNRCKLNYKTQDKEIRQLESKIKIFETVTTASRINLIRDFKASLELQCNKALASKTEILNEAIAFKVRENEELAAEVERQKTELNKNYYKIKALEEQIEEISKTKTPKYCNKKAESMKKSSNGRFRKISQKAFKR